MDPFAEVLSVSPGGGLIEVVLLGMLSVAARGISSPNDSSAVVLKSRDMILPLDVAISWLSLDCLEKSVGDVFDQKLDWPALRTITDPPALTVCSISYPKHSNLRPGRHMERMHPRG